MSPAAPAPARWLRRNLLYVSATLMDAALAFCTIGSTYLSNQEFQASEVRLGILALVMAGSYTVCCLVFGPLSDRWGRRPLLVAGALLDAAALLLAAQAGSFLELCACLGLFSAGQGAFWPSMEADIGDHSNARELPLRLGRFNVAWCLGFVIGWPLAGAVGQAVGQKWILVGGVALVLVSLLAYLGRTFEPEPLAEQAPDPAAAERAAERAVPFWVMALVLNFAAMGLSNTVRSLMPAVTGGEHSQLGGLYGALFFAGQVAVSVGMAGWTKWHFRAAPLVAGTLAAIGGATLCGLCPQAAIFSAGSLLAGVGCGVAYYSSIYYSIAVATGKGHRGGIHEAVLGAGGGVIPLLGGLLAGTPWAAQHFAWKAGVPFLTSAALLGAAFLVAAVIYLGLRRRAAP